MNKIKKIPAMISYLVWHWRAMGQIDKLWTSKKYSDLVTYCNLMVSKNPNDFLPFYYRGLAYEELILLDESIDDFKKSEQLLINYKRKGASDKDYLTRIPIQISRVFRKKQDKDKASDYADRAVQADNVDVNGLKWRASLKEDFGDFLGASEDLNEALKRRPKDKTLIEMRDRLTYIIIESKRESASR